MASHRTGTREELIAESKELRQRGHELNKQREELTAQRRALPRVKVEKTYMLDTEAGPKTLEELFDGRSQLVVYHFMFGPGDTAGCPTCSSIADGFSGSVVHLAHHDVTLYTVSRAPLAKIHGYKRRMGWSFPWASSSGSDFNYDFHVSHTRQEWQAGAVQYNFREMDFRPPAGQESSRDAWSESTFGEDWETYRREGPGMSAFALEDGAVYHAYSAYARGLDGLWGAYQWLDRAPKGRNETAYWWRRHDEYDRR